MYPVFGLVSRICPDLPISAALWPSISSEFICIHEKISGGRGSTPNPPGGAHDALPDPQIGPPMALHLRSHPTICAYGACPGLWCLNYFHLTSITGELRNYEAIPLVGVRCFVFSLVFQHCWLGDHLPSNRQHLSSGACLEDKREKIIRTALYCVVYDSCSQWAVFTLCMLVKFRFLFVFI